MCDELIVEGRGVLLYLNDVDCHCWDFSNDDSAQCVCDVELSVAELELELVAATSVQDPNAWYLSWLQSSAPDVSNLHSLELTDEQAQVWLAVHILPKRGIHV